MGENGAGKSTLIKALTGVYGIDAGTIRVRGEEQVFAGPGAAQQAGIATVYQEVNLCPNLTVAENIMLGREPRRLGRIDRRAVRERSAALLARLNLSVDPESVLGGHPLAVQQLVAIARAVDLDAAVLILDEPTSSLDADEVQELFRVIRDLRASGVAVLFVSHFLDQVYAIADRATILRNGQLVGEYAIAALPRLEMVAKMVGHELGRPGRPRPPAADRRRRPPRHTGPGRDRARPDRRDRPRRRHGVPRRGARPGRACSGRGGRSWPGCCSAPTTPTPAPSRWTGGLPGCAAPSTPSPAASRSARRTARAKVSSATSACATTSSSRCRPAAAGRGASPGARSTSSSRAGSPRWTSARPTRTC